MASFSVQLLKHLESISTMKNLFAVPGDKSDTSLFPLKPPLSCPGSGIERPPSNPPNPEVIAAGSFPIWLHSNLTNTQVGSLRQQYTNYRLEVSVWTGASETGSKMITFCLYDSVLHNNFKGQKRTEIWRL